MILQKICSAFFEKSHRIKISRPAVASRKPRKGGRQNEQSDLSSFAEFGPLVRMNNAIRIT
jgi:hypothetical protein